MGEIDNGEVNTSEICESEIREVTESPDPVESDWMEELDDTYKECLNNIFNNECEDDSKDEESDNVEDNIDSISCRNESLAGMTHPETGVPFEKRRVGVDGRQYEVVVPQFDSIYDVQLSEEKIESKDRPQFQECNVQLKEEISKNPELVSKFDEVQLEQIENGETPEGYSWHHDADVGRMQLVDLETHQRTGHTGGRFIWGGGTNNR